MKQLILLDSEAVNALAHRSHPKHAKVVSQAQLIATRRTRRHEFNVAVPVSVRVEAGWDRAASEWTFANRFRIADIALDGAAVDAAARIRARTGASVTDAHLGAAIQLAAADHVTVITSDPGDMRAVASGTRIVVIPI